MLGVEGSPELPVKDGKLTVDRPGHAIGGNPRRPRHGVTPIEFDERWRTDGSRALRTLGPPLAGPFWWHWKRRAEQSAREHASDVALTPATSSRGRRAAWRSRT